MLARKRRFLTVRPRNSSGCKRGPAMGIPGDRGGEAERTEEYRDRAPPNQPSPFSRAAVLDRVERGAGDQIHRSILEDPMKLAYAAALVAPFFAVACSGQGGDPV